MNLNEDEICSTNKADNQQTRDCLNNSTHDCQLGYMPEII
jgi:hypothetical protein